MSNFSIVEDTPAYKYEMEAADTSISASITPQTKIKNWHIEILIVVIGLLALLFFLSMGHMFAIAGPWVIYLGVLSIRRPAGSGKQLLRIITGASLLCLSVAALLLPGYSGPWYIGGGLLGLLVGLSYLLTTLFTMRKMA